MKNKNDKRGKSPANFYDRIAEMLNKAAIPQTITVEAEGVSPETFLATGITKRELYATVAMASLAHAVVTTPPTGGGRLRSDWARRVATQAAELAYYLTEAAAILAALLDARKSAERELANCSGRSRSNLDNEDDEDGFIKDSTLAPYIRNIIKQIDDQRRATAFKQLTLF